MSIALAVIGSLNMDFIMRMRRFPITGENVIPRSRDMVVGGGKDSNATAPALSASIRPMYYGSDNVSSYG